MLDEAELSAILDREVRQSLAYLSGDLAEDREDALKRYYGEKYGNEEEGRSQVRTRDVQEVVEWLLPSLLEIFTAGNEVVQFQPQGPEDEEAAAQATEYVNYVFQQDNNGFLILYTAIKDALIQKNGVVKVYWDEAAIEQVRTEYGIDDDACAILQDDPDVEIIQHSEYAGEMAAMAPQVALPPMGEAPPAAPQPLLHDVKYRLKQGRVKVEGIEPENFLLSKRAKALETTPYAGDRKRKPLSDLISEGLLTEDEALAIGGGDEPEMTGEAQVRRSVSEDDSSPELSDREGVMREVWVTDHYILVDYDEDGIAERRRVITVGSTSNIVLNEEWDGPVPYATGTPIIVPHRVIGQSVADQIKDLQEINTALWRQILDNLYRTNNPRYAGNGVDIDDWYSPNPGQLVKTDGNPNDMLREITVPFTAGAALPVLEMLQSIRENRTGVTRYNQGIDANSLNKTASGITQIMNAAQQRVKLIARILAETFVKPLFELIFHCVQKYQPKERVIRLRNEWVTMDPRAWESGFDMTINVGLGTGNKDQMLMHLQTLLGIQAQAVQMQGGANGPLVTMENIHHTVTKLTENAGFKNTDRFWTDPKMAPPQQPQPDPAMMKLQQEGELKKAQLAQQAEADKAKLALQAQNDQAKLALEAKTAESEMMLELRKMNAQLQLQREQAVVKASTDREARAGQETLDRERMQGEQSLKREGMAVDAASAADDERVTAIEKTLEEILASLAAQTKLIQKLAQSA